MYLENITSNFIKNYFINVFNVYNLCKLSFALDKSGFNCNAFLYICFAAFNLFQR